MNFRLAQYDRKLNRRRRVVLAGPLDLRTARKAQARYSVEVEIEVEINGRWERYS